jgi:SAM-dependent methyltransferase
MAGTSTLIGFGVLALAEHSLLKSIGITSLLGIGYSLLGTYLLLPPLLNMYMARQHKKIDLTSRKGRNIQARVRARYRTLEAYPRMFARFKLQFDPMFNDLSRMLAEQKDIKTIIDLGCGFGVPACWCLEQYREAEVYGSDPDPERVRVAGFAIGDRGAVTVGWAPELPSVPRPADVVLLLDMLHYLDEETAAAVLNRSFQALGNKGLLVTRFVLRPAAPSWSWRFEDVRIRLSGGRAWYCSFEQMSGLMKKAGFTIIVGEVSAVNPELVWMVGRADKETVDGGQNV